MSDHSDIRKRLERALSGRYRFERLLGEGGMSAVWLAEDLRHHRAVALKVLLPERIGPLGPRRFLQEIQFVAGLTHPHILPLFDSGNADGLLFYTAPFASSQSLRERLNRETRFPVDEALRIALEVADAVDYAHRNNVIHRDLKPENILIEDGHAVVADFGLARAISRAQGSTRTSSGILLGTPAYMSPEQASGGTDLDGRTDLYSLGCVLYEMLVGARPFPGRTIEELIFQHLSTAPPDITRRDVPPRVREAVKRALSKQREQRFATGADLARALEDPRTDSVAVRTDPFGPARGLTPLQQDSLRSLPTFGTRFVGRVEEISQTVRLLRRERLVTLVGVGGVGKTRLALEVARGLIQEYTEGVWFVDLAPLTDEAHVPQAIAAALALIPAPDSSLEDQLRALLREREVLLVLDNCEHVRTGCGRVVAALLQSSRGLAVLATGREALEVPGESTYLVPPLSSPAAGSSLPQLLRCEAVELFLDRARSADPGFRVTPENAAAVAEVCGRLEGVPLALELIAGRLKMLGLDEIRARLGRILRLATSTDSRFPERHRVLAATLDWSYGLLDEDARDLFMALSVFSSGWTLEGATAVCGGRRDELEVLDILTGLAAKSLVGRDREVEGRSRYRYLEIVRQFARERLAESNREPAVIGHLLDYLVTMAESAESGLWGSDADRWLHLLEADHDTILAAISRASDDASLIERGLRLAGSLYRFWYTRGYFGPGRRALTRVLAGKGSEANPVARIKALYGAAGMALYGGDYATSRRMYEEGLALCRTMGDRPAVAKWLVGLGLAVQNQGDLVLAERCYLEGLEIYREMDEARGTSVTLLNLSHVATRRGEIDLARARATEALLEARRNGNRVMEASIVVVLAGLSVERRQWAQARSEAAECLELVRALDLKQTGVEALEVVASLASASGDDRRSAEWLGAVDGLRQSWGVMHEAPERAAFQAKRERLREHLGVGPFEASYEAGRGLGFELAMEQALKWLESSAR